MAPLALLTTCLLSSAPHVTLWVWEAKQDLRALPETVDVALLVAEVNVTPEGLRVRRRVQPALLPPGRVPLAVVRLETHGRGLPEAARAKLVEVLVERVETLRTSGLQLDFDARPAEYADYRALLFALRPRLSKKTLSITGLASWCAESPPWFEGAPIDEVVPQFFRLGPDSERWRSRFATGVLARCGASVGVSTDEPLSLALMTAPRVFVFHPGTWSPKDLADLLP